MLLPLLLNLEAAATPPTGVSARLWSFAPDWSRSFDVTRAYLTDVFTSRNGTEQRRATRDQPRLAAQFRSIVSGPERQTADHYMRTRQNQLTVIPDFARWALLTGSSAALASTLTISPMPAWVAAEQPLVLCGAGGVREEVTVESVAGSTITLADPLANAWATGAVLRPTFYGLLNRKTVSSRLNLDTAAYDIRIESDPGGEPPRVAGTAWATLNDIEIFTLQPDYASPPQISDIWPVEPIDYGRGVTANFRPIDRYSRGTEQAFTGLSVAQATQLEQFFDRMKGRRGSFYLPTGEKDFTALSFGADTMLVSGPVLADDFGDTDYAAVNEGVAVYLKDGTALYRRITGIVASGGDSEVRVDSPWSFDPADVARISRMNLTRFSADDMTTSWRTPLSASARLGFVQVRA